MNDQNGSRHLFLLALVISVTLWLVLSFTERGAPEREKSLTVTVTYHVPDGLIILNPVQTVNIRIRGRREAIEGLNPFRVDVDVELDEQPGPKEIFLAPENVSVPSGLNVISVDPNRLRLRVDEEVQRTIPLEVQVTGEPAAGAIAQEWSVEPDAVMLRGPKSLLDQLSTIPVEANLDGHALSFWDRVVPGPLDPLIQIVEPTEVTVYVTMQPPMQSSFPGR